MPNETALFGTNWDWGKEMGEFKLEANEDVDFTKPITGRYVAQVKDCFHDIGVFPSGDAYDRFQLMLQITETIDGDKGLNRYLRKRYQNTPEGARQLAKDLFTAGIQIDISSKEAFDLCLANVKDKMMNVRTWAWTPKTTREGTPIPEEEQEPRQQFVIVKEFAAKGKKKEDVKEIPF